MSLADSPRSSVFTFESRTHCLSLLGRLDEQRRHDLLCDVTVAVDGQSFRAHRSVLTACSEYFARTVSKYVHHGVVLSLPQEVTAAGFEPLLNFAYTSKLLFSKQDVLEVRSAASILGFRDLDKACFEFLLPKFFNGGRSPAPFQRNICCKKKCKRRLSKEDNSPPNDISESDAKPVSDLSSDQEVGWPDNQSGICKIGINKSPTTPTSGTDKQPKETNDYFLQCTKYRKFLACCTEKTLDLPARATLPLSGHSSRGCEDQSESVVENPGRTAAVHRRGSVKATAEEQFHTESHESTKSHSGDERGVDGDMEAKGNPGDQARGRGRVGAVDVRSSVTAVHLRDRSKDGADCSEASSTPGQMSLGLILHHHLPELSLREDGSSTGPAGPAERSRVEMEVARHLAEGLSPGHPPLPPPDTGHYPGSSSLDWLPHSVQRAVGATCCLFLQDLGPAPSERKVAEGAELCESAGTSPSQKCPPCVSPLNSAEEVDSETETEGDDSCALEKARQVQLPFSVDWIVDLSKYDFQQLLRKETLNPEQLEFVHDMRRRSKNRMAAKRCRKRKLDCIYNLECEINKLRTEKERMLAEQDRLHQLKMKSWHAVSALCHKICSEASLLPEQLQVLAKYASADCPLASLIPRIDAALSGPAPPPQAKASDLDVNEAHP